MAKITVYTLKDKFLSLGKKGEFIEIGDIIEFILEESYRSNTIIVKPIITYEELNTEYEYSQSNYDDIVSNLTKKGYDPKNFSIQAEYGYYEYTLTVKNGYIVTNQIYDDNCNTTIITDGLVNCVRKGKLIKN